MAAATCIAIIPAKNEADRVARTIAAVSSLVQVEHVLVVDDGSTDATAQVALAAGASVIAHHRNRGKAAALHSGLQAARSYGWDQYPVLFVDADLTDSAAGLADLAAPVLAGQADLTIAVLPPQRTPGGGRGFVVRLARNGIRQLTGVNTTQPLSGMRCLSPEAVAAVTPFAAGWGVEVGMTIDAVQAGLRVLEVPCELHHRVTGGDLRGHLHRACQYRDVARALVLRRARSARRR